MDNGKSGVGGIEFVDVPYLILTRSRSGSNLFKDYLNSHPKVKSYGEVFGSIKNKNVDNIIEEVYSAENNPKASGFKFFYYHPNGEPHRSDVAKSIWAHLKAIPGLKVINLIRNPLRCIVSANIMKQIRDSNLEVNHVKMKPGENRPDINERRVILNPEDTLRMLKSIESLKQELLEYFGPDICTVKYSELCKNPNQIMNEVFAHLGIENVDVSSRLQKQNPESMEELIINFSEIREKLAQNGMLDLLTVDE